MTETLPTRILLVEDSPSDARLLQFDLSGVKGSTFEVTWVERIEDAISKLRERTFDIGLLDLTLPDSSGIATFTRIHEAAPGLPIVVLTGLDDETAGLDAIRKGVQDYLVKGTVDARTISQAIRYAIERKSTEEALHRATTELEKRFAEIQVANKNLFESRRAALNLMEDALLARKQAEAATNELRKNREDLNRAQAVAHTGSWRIDLWNNTLTWSDETYRIYGIPTGTAMSYETFLSAVHPNDRDYVDQKWNAAMAGEPYDIEHRIIVNGNAVKWVRDTAGLEFDDNGVLRSGFGTTQDITDRKNMETELSEKSRQLEKLVNLQTREIIVTRESLDTQTKERLRIEDELTHRQQALESVYAMTTAFETSLSALNDQVVLNITKILDVPYVVIQHVFENKMGMSSRFYKGKLFHDGGGFVPSCLARTAEFSASGGSRKNLEIHDFKRCNNCFPQERIRSYSGVPILNSRGEARGIICVLDNAERTFDENDVRLLEIFARYLSHEQTQRELESQLIRSNELRVLGQLTSGVAHEVRNPLNGIMAIMSALSKELSDAERFKPYLNHMQNQVVRLTDLMEDLLALGRPIREDKKSNSPIAQTVETALAAWQQSVQNKREVLFVKPTPGDKNGLVHADCAKIEQAVINLLENAHQHTPDDKPIELSIEIISFDKVRITVKDNGPGIPEDIMPRVFEPFFTTRKGGTGLGLSIVRHIVESHGGTIDVKNNEDRSGATFTIDLPMGKESSQ
jgi:two-component system CheB/CheR fusion protein